MSAPGNERAIELGLFACAAISTTVFVAVLVLLADGCVGFLVAGASLEVDLWTLLFGTLLTTAIAAVVGIPLGVGTAIFLAEYASPSVRRVLRPGLELAVGVPSAVFGYFTLVAITPLLRAVVPGVGPHNALGPGVAMGMMMVPTIAALGHDAIRAVPRGPREAAQALGADELRTAFDVVLPAAAPGLVAAILLAIGRALGETMIIVLAAGGRPATSLDPREPIQTLTGHLLDAARGDAAAVDALLVVGAALFLVTAVVHATARKLGARSGGDDG